MAYDKDAYATKKIDTETTKLNLQNDIRIEGKLYKRGMNVTVPKNQADNIAEIDYTAQQSRMNLIRQPQTMNVQMGIDPLTGRPFAN